MKQRPNPRDVDVRRDEQLKRLLNRVTRDVNEQRAIVQRVREELEDG